MGLFDKVKKAFDDNKGGDDANNNDNDYIKKAEGYLGEERVNQFKSKIGEDNFDKLENTVRNQFSKTSIDDSDKKNNTSYSNDNYGDDSYGS